MLCVPSAPLHTILKEQHFLFVLQAEYLFQNNPQVD